MDDFQQRVGVWAESVFTQATSGSIMAHLEREIRELAASVHLGPPWDEEEEAADCLLLLLHLAHKRNYSLFQAAERKFAINQQRQWGTPDADGVVEHVREV